MKLINKTKWKDIGEIGTIIGLSQNDIEQLIQHSQIPEQISMSIGPGYKGSYYGTISIKNFE